MDTDFLCLVFSTAVPCVLLSKDIAEAGEATWIKCQMLVRLQLEEGIRCSPQAAAEALQSKRPIHARVRGVILLYSLFSLQLSIPYGILHMK